MEFTVVLVGAGNMGGAMLRGWLSGGLKPSNLAVIDPLPSKEMADYLQEHSVSVFADAGSVTPPDVLILAVKPQMMAAVLPGLKQVVGPETVAVSVAAGTTISTISESLEHVGVVRSMPNTPSLVGRGITVACPGAGVTPVHRENVSKLLKATGKLEWVEDEALMDAVTAVSGSGPAYVFFLAECMARAGIEAGLPEKLAATLARETVAGAGELLYLADEAPAILRENVTSPGGTTAAALEVLMEPGAISEIVQKAVLAAKKRSQELS
ncbi:MAG: pyrroline-5-carboxylate reductase [Pseudomonadota bacterium]